ncbi:MAG: methyltransferase family protein [Alphaproteobacteria bacterium]
MRKNFWSFYQYAGNGTYLYAFDFIVAGISPMAFSRIFLVAIRGSLCFIVGRRYLLFVGLFFLDERGEAEVKNFRLNSRKLVTEGPYRFVRNPMALGTGAILAGEALYFGSWYIFIWALVVIEVMSYYITHVEEYKLANKFGQSYINYKLDVGKWWPRKIIFKEWLKRK